MKYMRWIAAAVAFGCLATSTVGFVTPVGASASGVGYTMACPTASPDGVRCFVEEKTVNGVVVGSSTPTGLFPADIQAAYNLPSGTAGAGQTVGIVDAFDDPNAEADLAVYRTQFGLGSCITGNGCFRKVDESGGTNYPRGSKGWGQEISLDLDMVSATCPMCHIILVEASSGSLKNVGESVNEAVALGATEVSNSYGGNEKDHNDARFDSKFYDHPGVPLTAATGDYGYGDSFIYPAASPFVTAVGGTNLTKDGSTRGYSETAWQNTTSGCSRQEAKPSWQTDTGCTTRTVADVSAVAADVASYDTFRDVGWSEVRGTSVGSPIIASVYALAGNGSSINNASAIYSNTGSLFDVTSGSNGTCTATYLCNAGPGYDGPTGWGTPNGTGAF